MEPETSYARLGDDRIAYQVVGDGPVDLVISRGSFSTLDATWSIPETAAPYLRLASACRLILFDRLGTGWSDSVPLQALPPLERRWAEIHAVMDAAGSRRAVVMGVSDGGSPAMFGAATAPDLVAGLILMHSAARTLHSHDYPIGISEETRAEWTRAMSDWDIDTILTTSFPSRGGDPSFMQWGRRNLRSMATPSAMVAYTQAMTEIDVRDLLPSIKVPTMVVHRRDYRWVPAELSRYVADHIVDARYVELPGADSDLYFGESGPLVDVITGFLAEIDPTTLERRLAERMMATILFTDIVASTERAQASGDARWVSELQLHDAMSREHIARHGGRLVKSTGDGVLALFDGPGRGLHAAGDMSASLDRVGLPVRAGLHAGEIEVRGQDVAGVGVHIAARVMAEAGPAEVMVSRTVRDLVVGSDFRFVDRGSHHLKGVDGEWQLFALAGP
jgi:class 3 adenylate cyclase/pimeloyl-ACP methyl ester carboxylesterase